MHLFSHNFTAIFMFTQQNLETNNSIQETSNSEVRSTNLNARNWQSPKLKFIKTHI